MNLGVLVIAALLLVWGLLVLSTAPGWSAESVTWGGTGCRIDATPGLPHAAEITCTNILTGGVTLNHGTIGAGDLTANIEAEMGPGGTPDTFRATVPEGYIASPQEITIDEGSTGVIRVYAIDAMPMG